MKKLTKRQLRLKKKFEKSWNDYLKPIDGILGEGKMLRGRDNLKDNSDYDKLPSKEDK